MKDDPVELRPISQTQGRIFKYFASIPNVDLYKTIENYMRSDFCNIVMDSLYAYEQLSRPEELLSEITPFVSVDQNIQQSTESAYWVGFMYRYIARKYNISSKELIKKVPPNTIFQIENETYQDGDVKDFEKAMLNILNS